MILWTANKVKDFVARFVRVNGQPAKLLDWQINRLIEPFYGDGSRRYKRVQLWLPKKSGKSFITALLCLIHCLERSKAFVLVCASTVKQAEIIFDFVCDIIDGHPSLRKRFWQRPHLKEIHELKTKGRIRVISGSPKGKAGPNVTMLAVDEIADFTPSDARMVFDQLKFSTMASYNTATQVILSTAGFQREGHIAFDMFSSACQIQAEPSKDPHTLAIVYSVPEQLDWKDSSNWWSYLPSCPAIVPREFYLEEYARLTQDTLGEAAFRTLLLNQYLGFSGEQWISAFTWSNCLERFKEEELYACKMWGGLDFSLRFDLTCWCLLVEKDERLYLLPRFFCCEDGLQKKEKADGFPYSAHARNPDNHLTITPGDTIDPAYVRRQIIEDCKNYRVQSLGYDASFFSDETRQILQTQHGIEMIEVKQNYKVMSAPTLQFERWTRTKRLAHAGNNVMNWCVENTVLRTDGASVMVDSKRSRARIDGVQAATIAIQRFLDRPKCVNPFVSL